MARRKFLSAVADFSILGIRNEGAGIEKDLEDLDEKLVGYRRPNQSLFVYAHALALAEEGPAAS